MQMTVSRRAHLARHSRLSTKHVGFRHYCARAPTRGGGDAGDRFASISPRPSISAQYEARGLPSLLCASTDTGRWRRWRPFASSSPRRQLQQQAQLRSKHVGFYNLCVRALARGGEYAGDRFASSSLRESTSAWDEARGLPVLCTSLGTRLEICWRLIGIEPYLSRSTVWRPREIAEFSPSNRGRAQGAPATPPDGS